MLTTPDNLLFLHLLDDGLQNELLHHLSRDGGEADRPVVPWVLLLGLFEDWSDTPVFKKGNNLRVYPLIIIGLLAFLSIPVLTIRLGAHQREDG